MLDRFLSSHIVEVQASRHKSTSLLRHSIRHVFTIYPFVFVVPGAQSNPLGPQWTSSCCGQIHRARWGQPIVSRFRRETLVNGVFPAHWSKPTRYGLRWHLDLYIHTFPGRHLPFGVLMDWSYHVPWNWHRKWLYIIVSITTPCIFQSMATEILKGAWNGLTIFRASLSTRYQISPDGDVEYMFTTLNQTGAYWYHPDYSIPTRTFSGFPVLP